jgi:hypothetical protein
VTRRRRPIHPLIVRYDPDRGRILVQAADRDLALLLARLDELGLRIVFERRSMCG